MHLTLIAAPAVLGMLAGAGLFGRELDQGTHVFAAAGGYNGPLVTVPDGAWLIDIADVDAQGRAVPMTSSLGDCYRDATTEQAYEACQRAAGVVETRVRFHPADRYWPFQLIETGILAALAAGALALGIVGLRRRVH